MENYSDNLNISYIHEIKLRSQMIYIAVLVSTLIALAALPFITVHVSVRGSGIIQSIEEKYELQAPVNGRVNLKFLKDNHSYKKGDTLLMIDVTLPSKQNELISTRLTELSRLKKDLHQLIRFLDNPGHKAPNLYTAQSLSAFEQFSAQFQTLQSKYQQCNDNYRRYKLLFDRKVVSSTEFEKYTYDLQNAKLEKTALISKYRNNWQMEINGFQNEEREQTGKQNDLLEQEKLYVVKAPVNGTLMSLNNTQTGNYVFSGQKLAEISPDTMLTAICYVKPSDIGFIQKGQLARVMVDAFNSNQWGFMQARVIDISKDVVMDFGKQSPVFKVKCQLLKPYLSLKNGYHGFIKKGMTIDAHFMVAKRTAYQLLYDKLDNWLTPGGNHLNQN